jgi:antitoxin component of RelBE/YafQ-DinJ toxin-antitoxin module
MTAKLTLSINKDVIKNAKHLSQKKGISISQMVEKFLKQSIEEHPEKQLSIKENLPPFLKKMHGAIKTTDKRAYRDVYREYITEKYSR